MVKNDTTYRNYVPDIPYHLVWIATNACNARCIHCSTEATKRLPGELSTNEVKKMFWELRNAGVFDIAISGGEPFVRKDMMEIIEYMASIGLKVGIGSNGSTVTKKITDKLKLFNVSRLQISIDGTEEIHDLSRRWNGLFKKSKQAILYGIESGLNVHVCMTLHKINYSVMEDVISMCADWGVKRFNLSRFIPTGRGDLALDLDKELWHDLMLKYENIKTEYFGRMEMTTHLSQSILLNSELNCYDGFIGCQAGIGQGCIGPTGDVSPCVMLPVKVGNIRDYSFEDIWRDSPLINNLKSRNLLKGKCGVCSYKEKCGGCRAVAYSYTGDVFETDSRCWLTN